MTRPRGASRTRPAPRREFTFPTWVFGSLLLAFALGVFVFGPDALPEYRQRVLAVLMALLAGLFGFFLTGDVGLELKWVASRFGEVGVKAAGGMALFVLVLIWWLSPLAPVQTEEMRERLEGVESAAGRIEAKTDQIVALLKDELSLKNRQIGELQAQLELGQLPAVSERARELAAQIPKTADPYARALKAIAEGRFDEARQLLDEVIATQEEDLGTAYHARGETEFYAGRYPDAASWYKKALALRPDDPNIMIDAAVSSRYAGEHEAAEPLYRRALEIQQRTLGPEHEAVGVSLDNLATLYRAQGKLDEAEPLALRALGILEKALGPDDPDVATTCNNLASLYQAQGKLERAGPFFLRALSIQEKHHGPDHPEVAIVLNNLGLLRQTEGKLDEAESLYRRALTIDERSLPADHPDVGFSLNNLATLHQLRGAFDSAAPLYERSLAIYEKTFGPNHPEVGKSVNNLATLYEDQGKRDEAERLYQRGLAINEKSLGPDHPELATSLNNLAKFYQLHGKPASAEPLYRRAVGVAEKSLGTEHPVTLKIRSNYASLLRLLNRDAEARVLEGSGEHSRTP